jgi:hypothetical protein
MEQSVELKRRLFASILLNEAASSAKGRSFSPVVSFLVGMTLGVVLTILLFQNSI